MYDFFLAFDEIDTFKYIYFLHINLDKICDRATTIYIDLYREKMDDKREEFIIRLQKYLKQILIDDRQDILIIEHADDIFIGNKIALSPNPDDTIGILRSQLDYGHTILEKVYKYFNKINFNEHIVTCFVSHTKYYGNGCLPARLGMMLIWYNTVTHITFSDKWYMSLEIYYYPDLSEGEQREYLKKLSSAYIVLAELEKWEITPERFAEWVIPAIKKFNISDHVLDEHMKAYD